MTLYRGDSAWNRKRRTYGLAWSTKREVAEGFARGTWRTFKGGSVLLSTVAPREAIICCVGNERGEAEYLVDRRALKVVSVVERFAQQTFEENQIDVDKSWAGRK